MILKITIQRSYRSLFFLACLSFVLWQCYLLFAKFLQKPKSTYVEIDDTKNWPIPKFFFCPEFELGPLQQCGLTLEEYRDNWIGNCDDPKSLYENASRKPEFFTLRMIVKSFQGEKFDTNHPDQEEDFNYKDLMDSLWKPVDFVYDLLDDTIGPLLPLCYELIIPERLQKQGIQSIKLLFAKVPFFKISPPGYLLQNHEIIPIKLFDGYSLDLILDYEINQILPNDNCNPDPSYNRDECVIEQLLIHSMKLFECIPPSIGNYGIQVCDDPRLYNMSDVDKLIVCPKPCTMFKMQPRTTTYNSTGLGYYASLDIRFHQIITISNDQYSYTWLNLVAEFGGYVGLFLGYSVFQMTDLMDILYQRDWVGSFKSLLEVLKKRKSEDSATSEA